MPGSIEIKEKLVNQVPHLLLESHRWGPHYTGMGKSPSVFFNHARVRAWRVGLGRACNRDFLCRACPCRLATGCNGNVSAGSGMPLAMRVALLARVRNVNQLARIKAGLPGLVGQQFQNRLGQLFVACQYP